MWSVTKTWPEHAVLNKGFKRGPSWLPSYWVVVSQLTSHIENLLNVNVIFQYFKERKKNVINLRILSIRMYNLGQNQERSQLGMKEETV